MFINIFSYWETVLYWQGIVDSLLQQFCKISNRLSQSYFYITRIESSPINAKCVYYHLVIIFIVSETKFEEVTKESKLTVGLQNNYISLIWLTSEPYQLSLKSYLTMLPKVHWIKIIIVGERIAKKYGLLDWLVFQTRCPRRTLFGNKNIIWSTICNIPFMSWLLWLLTGNDAIKRVKKVCWCSP